MDFSDQPVVEAAPPVETPEVPAAPPIRALSPPQRGSVSGFGDDLIASVQSLIGTVVIAIFVITFAVQAFQIPSESMENTLLVGDYLLVNKLCYGGHGIGSFLMPYQKIARGDIVVFHYPVDPQQHFVKRVIGLPGDRLRLVNKKVFINGKPMEEPYVHFLEPPNNLFRDNFPRTDIPAFGLEGKWWLEMRKLVEDGQLIVPEGHYFVMGDNRDDSQDSRYWGFVPRENIIGRPLVIYWSVQEWDRNSTSTFAGRLYHLAYAVTHMFQITRWHRTLRLVH
ncbi:MAG TPA: signal peptidase I [Candidatus Sulfotelmatobacter sp.]|jgi:signal peptidase I|nr:signal peptidase I [Candidatus Sulfotelmatobacter sp.]